MENKSILFLCQYFYPEKISSGVLPFELAEYLAGKGYKINALVGYPKEYNDIKNVPTKEVINGVKIQRVRYIQSNRSNFFGRIINYIGLCLSIFFHPKNFFGNDIYICYTNPPLLPLISAIYKKIFHKKMILVVYDLYPDVAIKLNILNSNSIIVKFLNNVNNFVYNNSDKIVVLSTEMKEYLIKNKKIALEKIEIIPNWYKNINYSPYKKRKNEKFKIFYGGNMGLAQNIDVILKTAIELKNDKNIEFHFVGHGIKKEKIIEAIEKEKLTNCHMYDFLPKDDYDKLILEADILVVSLEEKVKGLGSPSKVYSYLASGKPIIAIMPENTDVVKDIKNEQNGIVITDYNYKTLISEIKKIVNNENLLTEMGIRSRKLFERKYTLNKCANKYIDLLR